MDPDLGYIMKVVEEYKHRLTDGEYLEICNALKNAHHKIKGQNRENFVRRIRKRLVFGLDLVIFLLRPASSSR